MKKILTLLVVALTAVSFASVAMATEHEKKAEGKSVEAAAPATEKSEKAEKKDTKKEKKAKKEKNDDKKKDEAKPAVKGKKELSGC